MTPEEMMNYAIIDQETLRQIIMSQFQDDPMFDDDPIQEDLYIGYSEDHFENENQQAFLDAGHFYGLI